MSVIVQYSLAEQELMKTFGLPRSGKWPTFERHLIEAHPYCCFCGITLEDALKCGGRLVGHHKLPFHVDPSKELDPDNIGIICETRGNRDCHFTVGHLGLGWQHYNIRFDDVCAMFLAEVRR